MVFRCIGVKKGGCAGMEYTMDYVAEVDPHDEVVEQDGARYREAEFQWRRALSFINPEDMDAEADPDRIRRKLDVGLLPSFEAPFSGAYRQTTR